MDTNRHLLLYSKGRYKRKPENFIDDMRQLCFKSYGLSWMVDSYEDVPNDWLFLMLKQMMEFYGVADKLSSILAATMFQEYDLGRSEVLEHTYREKGYFVRGMESYGKMDTYLPPIFKSQMEKTLWLMMRSIHLMQVRKKNDSPWGCENTTNFYEDLFPIGSPDYEFA